MDDQIRELAEIGKAITEGFKMVAHEVWEANRQQTNALLELSEVVTSILEEYKRNSGGPDDKTPTGNGGRHKKSKKRKGD